MTDGSMRIIRLAQRVNMHEIRDGAEATLADPSWRLSRCNFVFEKGLKREGHPTLEVHRGDHGRPVLRLLDSGIVAVASDRMLPEVGIPVVDLDDIAAIAELVVSLAEPFDAVVTRIEGDGTAH